MENMYCGSGGRVGLDIAVGPEDTVVYMGVGSAWN